MKYLVTAISFIFLSSLPSAFGSYSQTKTLNFYHTHTGKTLKVTYSVNGAYQEDALARLNSFLADWRNGKQHEIDPRLLDILWAIKQLANHDETFEVISAYRSEETNAMLRSKSKGVAKNSQHIHGKAIDVRLRGLDTHELLEAALELSGGGVGYYAQSDFVHVDTGPVRRW